MNKTHMFVLAAFLGGCPPAVEKVSVDPASETITEKGKTISFKASPVDKDGKPVTDALVRAKWEVSDAAVLKLESNKATAQKSGDATVSVTIDGKKGSATVKVMIPAKVEVAPAAAELDIAGTAELKAVVKDDAGRDVPTAKIAWSTSDGKVVSVEDGKVTAVGPGSATIAAQNGELKGEATITVKMPVIGKVELAPASANVKVGETAALQATVKDDKDQAVKVPVTFASSNDKVVTVGADGTVTAVGAGKADVTATVGDKSAKASITVKK